MGRETETVRRIAAQLDRLPPNEAKFLASFAYVLARIAHAAASVSGGQQRPSFGATVARVRVDVIVTDEEGRFVADLRPDELVLYEDGAEQQILSTQVVDLAAGTVTEFRGTSRSGADAAASFDTRPVSSATSGEFGALIYLVDLPGLDRRNKDSFAEAWLRLLDESEPHGIPRDVYMID